MATTRKTAARRTTTAKGGKSATSKASARKATAKKTATTKIVVWRKFEPKLRAIRDAMQAALASPTADHKQALAEAITGIDALLAKPPGVENIRKA